MKNEHRTEFAGIHSLNPFVTFDSSNRSVMMASHFSQRLVVCGATEKRIQTGVEQEFAKHTFSVKMPANGRILKVIDRYPRRMDVNSIPMNPETIVIYEDADTQEIGMVSIPRYNSFHQYFGYEYKMKPAVNKLMVGNFIEKDTIFADSPAVSDEGGFMYGVSMNMAFMSHPAVSEDGVLISESALKKLKFKLYDTRVVEFGANSFPLNLYGTSTNYKPFPEIGEYLREDGLLATLRRYDYDMTPVEMSIFDTCEPDWYFDKSTYVRGPGGRIVDIKVYRNTNVKNPMPTGIMDDMDKYAKALKSFYQEIIDTERQIRSDRKRKFGDGRISLKPDLHRLTVEGLSILGEKPQDTRQNLNLTYRDMPLDEYRVEFVIEYEMTPSRGFKATGSHGDKGVICKVVPDSHMPVDQEGNRAEIVMDAGSTINRMNVGRLYEHYISAAARDVSKSIRSMLNIPQCKKSQAYNALLAAYQQNKQAVSTAYLYLLGFYKIVSPRSYDFFSSDLTEEEKLEHLADIIEDGLYVYWPIENEPEGPTVIKQLEEFYKPTYGPVTYVGNSGRQVVTEEPVRIAPFYVMLLEKIADDWMAVSSAKAHHFGVLTPVIRAEKHSLPFSNTPVRFLGETEGRLMTGYSGPEAAAEMVDRSNSPATRKQIIRSILNAPKPTDIDYNVDRNVVPLGGAKPVQLANHVLQCAGLQFVYEPEND